VWPHLLDHTHSSAVATTGHIKSVHGGDLGPGIELEPHELRHRCASLPRGFPGSVQMVEIGAGTPEALYP